MAFDKERYKEEFLKIEGILKPLVVNAMEEADALITAGDNLLDARATLNILKVLSAFYNFGAEIYGALDNPLSIAVQVHKETVNNGDRRSDANGSAPLTPQGFI